MTRRERVIDLIETLLLLFMLAGIALVAVSAVVAILRGVVPHPAEPSDTTGTYAIAIAMLVFSLPILVMLLQALAFHVRGDRKALARNRPSVARRRGGAPWERGWQP